MKYTIVYQPIDNIPFGVPVLGLTKPFFCPMVKLYRDDYKRIQGRMFFPNETGKLLFPAEYHFSKDGSSLFVCVEDFNGKALIERNFGVVLKAHKKLHCVFGIVLLFLVDYHEFCFY
ncbi:MAG: hypothetical protein AB2693_27375 [Candidatus Thiodiazotropha sp.]